MNRQMTAIRILTGLVLALVVSTANGLAGLGYTAGGEFEASMQAAVHKSEGDERWKSKEAGGTVVKEPRNEMAAVSLIAGTKYGRFGLALQILCTLQFLAGVFLIFRPRAGLPMTGFFLLVAALGIAAEIIGARYSSSWGTTNTVGLVTSVVLVFLSYRLYQEGCRSFLATSGTGPDAAGPDPQL